MTAVTTRPRLLAGALLAAATLALLLVLLNFPGAALAQPSASVAIDLSPSDSVPEGTEIAVTMSFGGLTDDDDRATKDYIFRADVLDSDNRDADACEEPAGGYGLGVDRYMWQVDDDPEVRPGTISTGCPAGDYTLRASISSAANVELASASASFSVVSSEPPPSNDAALSALALSGVDFGVFNSETTQYTASVANDVAETTVTVTTNHDGAGYVVKLDGAADPDGTVPLAVGENAVSVEVTAEDGQTARTYTVTVTRADAPLSSDATLSALALSGVDFDPFDSETTQYTASVANGVAETTVTATTNHDGAGYVVKLDGAVDEDRTIPLAVGANAVAIEVTAEDGETTKTYTVRVTRAEAPLSSDATLSALALSGVDFGVFNSDAIEYTASVANGVAETTVTATTNHDGATYVVKLDGEVDEDETVSLAVGENAVSVEVTAEDGETARTYTVTVTRAAPALPVTVDLGAVSVKEGAENAVTMSFGGLTPDDDRSTTDYIFRGDVLDAEGGDADACEGGGLGRDRYMYQVDDYPEVRTAATSADCPPGIYTLTASLFSAGRAELASASAQFAVLPPPTVIPVAGPGDNPLVAKQGVDDATLSALSVSPGSIHSFDSDTTTYHVGVANSVDQVTVTATPSHSGATIAWSPADADGSADHQVDLSVGLNTVTITVTSQDTNNTKVYTIYAGRGVTTGYGWKAVDDFNTLTAAGNTNPKGIWSDGDTMWVSDDGNDKLYAYNLPNKARDASKDFGTLADAGNNKPLGIWSNGDTMWVADSSDDKIYAYNLSDKSRDASKDFNTLVGAGNSSPFGIWSNGDTMWVADNGDQKIYAYNMADKSRDASKDFNTLDDAGNHLSTGIWSDGATMWVADPDDDKIYAYDMADKSRDASKDFNTLDAAGNGAVTDIWSDGGTMWVADSGRDKLTPTTCRRRPTPR